MADGAADLARGVAEKGGETVTAVGTGLNTPKGFADAFAKEVANLTVMATEKVTRKSLTPDDHRRLIEDALKEVDFSTLAGEEGSRRN